jgi:hypothetical protein
MYEDISSLHNTKSRNSDSPALIIREYFSLSGNMSYGGEEAKMADRNGRRGRQEVSGR